MHNTHMLTLLVTKHLGGKLKPSKPSQEAIVFQAVLRLQVAPGLWSTWTLQAQSILLWILLLRSCCFGKHVEASTNAHHPQNTSIQ
jgi:hypothetical protein